MSDSALVRIIRYILAVITIAVTILSIITHYSSVRGGQFELLGFYGLFQPLLMLSSLLLFLYWTIRLKITALLPLFAIVLNWGFISSVYQIPIPVKTTENGKINLTLATYNAQGFKFGQQRPLTVGMMSDFMKEKNVDILCMQEVDYDSTFTIDSIAHSFYYLPYKMVVYSEKQGFNLMVLSRFPILHTTRFRFGKEGNQAMQSDLLIEGDTIRLFNFHLQTTNFRQTKYDLVPENVLWHVYGEAEKTKVVYDILHKNYEKRTEQAAFIQKKIEETSFPILACGDMNSNPSSYTYHQLKGHLKDGFRTCGSGYEYTLLGMYRLYRIDYIFHSEDFIGRSYQSYKMLYSDHKPVIMEMSLK